MKFSYPQEIKNETKTKVNALLTEVKGDLGLLVWQVKMINHKDNKKSYWKKRTAEIKMDGHNLAPGAIVKFDRKAGEILGVVREG